MGKFYTKDVTGLLTETKIVSKTKNKLETEGIFALEGGGDTTTNHQEGGNIISSKDRLKEFHELTKDRSHSNNKLSLLKGSGDSYDDRTVTSPSPSSSSAHLLHTSSSSHSLDEGSSPVGMQSSKDRIKEINDLGVNVKGRQSSFKSSTSSNSLSQAGGGNSPTPPSASAAVVNVDVDGSHIPSSKDRLKEFSNLGVSIKDRRTSFGITNKPVTGGEGGIETEDQQQAVINDKGATPLHRQEIQQLKSNSIKDRIAAFKK
jgi:hypothetical protein